MKEIDEVTGIVVDSALKVHQALGPGLLESVYEIVLAHELVKRGLKVERQKEGLHRIVNQYVPSASPRLRVNQTAAKEAN